jgi:BMFP domain-containing protein YqiC
MESSRASDFIKTFMEQLPPGIQALNEEIKIQLQECLQRTLQKLSLVTREEFDIQTEVLAKTRAKLEQLEALLK